MECKTEIDKERKLMINTLTGDMTYELTLKQIVKNFDIFEKMGLRLILSNCSKANIVMTKKELIYLAKISLETMKIPNFSKRAIISEQLHTFVFENANQVKGNNTRMFPNRKDAEEWLFSEEL